MAGTTVTWTVKSTGAAAKVHDRARPVHRRQARQERRALGTRPRRRSRRARPRPASSTVNGAGEPRGGPVHAAGLRRRGQQGQGELGAQQLPRGDCARRHRAARRRGATRRQPPDGALRAGHPARAADGVPDRTPPPRLATATPEPFSTRLVASPGDVSPLQSARFAFTRQRGRATASSAGSTTRPSPPCTSPVVIPSMLAGEHAFEVRAKRGATYAVAARKAWRIEFEAPAPGPDRAAAAAPETQATPGRRRRDHARRRHHRVPLHGRRPDPEGGRPGAIEAAAAPRSCAASVHAPQRHADRGRAGHGRSTIRSSAAPRPAPTAASTSPSTAARSVTLAFEREGYIPSQRQLEVPSQDYGGVEEIVMVPVRGPRHRRRPDRRRAAGRAGLDDHRRRRHRAARRCCSSRARTPRDAARRHRRRPLGDTLNVRATEFTIGANGPAAMPGELPPTSRLHVRGRVLASTRPTRTRRVDVKFTSRSSPTSTTSSASRPARPSRWATTTARRAQWVPAKDGVVIKIVVRVRRPRGRRRRPATAWPTPARARPRSASTTTSWPSSPSSTTPARACGARRSRTSRRGTTTGPTACRTAPAAPTRAARTTATPPATTRAAQGGSIILCEDQVARRAGRRSPARRTRSSTSPTACPAAAPATRSRSR